VLLLEDRVKLAKRLEDRRLVREIEVAVLREKAFEHELVRCGSAQPDVRVPVADDLVIGSIVLGGKARIAERRQ
jgi:hypothetical protein